MYTRFRHEGTKAQSEPEKLGSFEDKKYQVIDNEKREYDTRYFRMDISPINQVQFNSYYRDRSVQSGDSDTKKTNDLLNNQQKIYLDLTVDRIPGINLNMRYQSNLQQYFPSETLVNYNLYLYRNFQSSLRIFPGRWIKMLTPLTFQLNYIPSWKGYLCNLERSLDPYDKFFNTEYDEQLISENKGTMIQIRSEWRPFPSFILYSDCYCRYTHQSGNSITLFSHLKL